MTAAAINIVVFKKRRGRKHYVRHLSSLRHELLVDADKEIVAEEASFHFGLVGRNRNWICVLDNERVNRPAAL